MKKNSHIDNKGNVQMVDIADKAITKRKAIASGTITTSRKTIDSIKENTNKKGDVLSVAQLAGIIGAKKTSDLIPLCHPLNLSSVKVDLVCDPDRSAVDIKATCKLSAKTGVEMEALTAVSVAALTVYDMCKAVDRGIVLSDIRLVHKEGGKSGAYQASGIDKTK